MLPLVDINQRIELYCTADRSVTMPADRKDLSVQWVTLQEAETVDVATATKVTVRPLSGTEQFVCLGSLAKLNSDRFDAAVARVLPIAVCAIQGPGIDCRTAEEVKAWLPCLPLQWSEPLGTKIIDDSCGVTDPLGKAV